MKYLIIIEPSSTGFSAYSPDLPGCVATGRTEQEVRTRMGEAVGMHISALREAGEEVPVPRSQAAEVEVAA